MIKWFSKTTEVEIALNVNGPRIAAMPVVTGDGADIVTFWLKTAYGRYGFPLQPRCTGYDLSHALTGRDLETFRFEVVEGNELITPPSDVPEGADP